MKVVFKLYASLGVFLPPGGHNHQVTLQVTEGTTPLGLFAAHAIPDEMVHLVLINGVFAPPGERNLPLSDGDELAIWPAVAGG